MPEKLSHTARSALMARVGNAGNRTTEVRVESELTRHAIGGWVKQEKILGSRADFYFPEIRLVLYVDGCFWHGCPVCHSIPATRTAFWLEKFDKNIRRDRRTTRCLRAASYHVIRVREHELDGDRWLSRLKAMIKRCERPSVS